MSLKEDVGEIIDRQWENRANSLEQVRKKLRSGWRNDDAVLNQYFQSCVANWKIYKGARTPQQVLKLQAIYKQAIYGDNVEFPPERMETTEGMKWRAWESFKGTSKEMAKRRFITFLSEIDPLLIDVMPDEKPPIGFPLDRRGIQICAKCNTVVGCTRPLLDQNKMNLKLQLFENEELHEPDNFRAWVKNALSNQRCVWGVHQAIARADTKPFMDWFNRDENRGFFAYDSTPLMLIIRELVQHHHEVTYDLMQRKDSIEAAEYNAQAVKTAKIKEVFEQLAGEEYHLELPCTRDSDACNLRRKADNGRNHAHPVELDPPTFSDVSTMEEAIELRKQCQQLGISPCTGVVSDIAQRCDIYRKRIAEHFAALKEAAKARGRNESRVAVHREEKARVRELSRTMFERQCWEACHMNLVPHILTLVRRGCNPNEESPKGLTPLLTLIMNDASVEAIEELIALKANVNHVNKFGVTPLIVACRLGEVKMVHVLMRNNASAMQKGGFGGRSALHWCVVHGAEELVRTIVEYLKDSAGDALRVTRFLDQQTDSGETALMLAAKVRNGAMCHLLCSLGSSPNMRDGKGRNAAFMARHEGWTEIADWLEKKVGAGVARLATFSDLQFEKQLRYGSLKLKEIVCEFGKTYLTLLQNRVSLHPLGCPFVSKSRVQEIGDKELADQRTFVDNHQYFIMRRDAKDFSGGLRLAASATDGPVLDKPDEQSLKEMRDRLTEMLALLRQGMTNSNAESPAKPLPWTALMCAVALNDVRTAKLLIREGANPNYPNCKGTTAVMLAAQLNNIDVLVELLVMGGDLGAVDNEGYTALAYAGSLPLPSFMERDGVHVLLDGDTAGSKLLSSVDVVKMALSCGVGKLKQAVLANAKDADPATVENHFKFMRLLEGYGLSGLQTERQVQDQVKTTGWRVKESPLELRALRGDFAARPGEGGLDPFEQEALRRYNEAVAAQKAALAEEEEKQRNEIRCPICTLNIPCAHFFKAAALQRFLNKQSETAAANSALVEGKRKELLLTASPGKKMKMKSRALEVLEEAHLGDRHTDRSLALMNTYRDREIELDRSAEQRRLQESQQEPFLAIEDGSQSLLLICDTRGIDVPQEGTVEPSNTVTLSVVPADPSTVVPHAASAEEDDLVVSDEDEDDDADEDGGGEEETGRVGGSRDGASPVHAQDSVSSKGPPAVQSVVSILKPTVRAATAEGQSPPVAAGADQQQQLTLWSDAASSGGSSPKKSGGKRVKFSLPNDDDDDDDDGALSSDPTSDSGNNDSERFSPITTDSHPFPNITTIAPGNSGSDDSPLLASELSGQFDQLQIAGDASGANGQSTSVGAGLDSVPVDGSFRKDESENPLGSVRDRKVYMFMRDNMHRHGQTDGLIVPAAAPQKQGNLSLLASKLRGKVSGAAATPSPPPLLPIKVQVSGWIFASLSDVHSSCAALDSVTLVLDVWGGILAHVQERFRDEWLPQALVEPVVDVKTWKPSAPRCAVCAIGFARFKDAVSQFTADPQEYLGGVAQSKAASVFENRTLCLPCAIRRDLYERVSASLPRSFRTSTHLSAWPLLEKEKDSGRVRRKNAKAPTLIQGASPLDSDSVSLLSSPTFGDQADDGDHNLPPSPVRSSKLAQLDHIESQAVSGDRNILGAIDAMYGPQPSSPSHPSRNFNRMQLGQSEEQQQLLALAGGGNENESVCSAVSQLTMSLEGGDSQVSRSTVSTISVVDPLKRPKELTLAPFLLTKGHFEEVERTVRIALGKTAVDEGEGMLVLLRLMRLQAEMYKAMGLWPLALGIYLDCADLTFALLGFSDYSSMAALGHVVLCLRQMQQADLAEAYVRGLCRRIEAHSLKAMRREVTKNIREQDRINVKTYLASNSIWTEQIRPALPAKTLQRRMACVLGVGGLYSLMTASDGRSVAARAVFVAHCLHVDKRRLGVFAEFAEYCFRLRVTSDPEVYRHMVQHLIQHQLAKTLVDSSEVARLYRTVTSRVHIEGVQQFLRFGLPLTVQAFDELLLHSLKLLVPSYRTFLLFDAAGALMRDNQVEVIAEAYDVAATVIQGVVRRKLAWNLHKVLAALRRKTIEDNKVKMANHRKFRSK